MKKALINGLLACAFLSPFIAIEDAEAREYCREYTKTIRVNGRMQSGYGTACQQPDGSWMIVDASGDVDPFDALRTRNVVLVAQDNPVYFRHGPRFRPVTYYAPVRHSYSSPGFFISYGFGDRDRGRNWRNHQRWNQHKNWDDDDDHDGHHGSYSHRRH